MLGRSALLAATNSEPRRGLQLWLDASDSSTITLSSGFVSEWRDKSANARHVSQLTTTARPSITTAGLGGKNIVTFDGVNDRLSGVMSETLDGTFAFFAVVVPGLAGDNPWVVSEAAAYSNYWAWLGTTPGGQRSFQLFNGSTLNPGALGGAVATGVAELSFGCRERKSGNNIISYYLNDSTFWEVSDPVSVAPQHSTISIGAQSNFGGRFLIGSIAEVLVITQAAGTAFDVSLRQLMAGYAAHKWGLAGLLPAGHPYKTTAPMWDPSVLV